MEAMTLAYAGSCDGGEGMAAGAEGCLNRHAECERWALLGECPRNRAWMQKTCPLACGVCVSLDGA